MIIYQLKRKINMGSDFLGSAWRLDGDVLYFLNKEDAKALQNRFNGDRITEITLEKASKFIFNIRLVHNFASFGRSFGSLKKAKDYCKAADDSKYHREVYKHKIYSSLDEFRNKQYESKQVFA